MTYCVAMVLDAGMIFASDTRTSAGVDHILRFRKMRTFVNPGDRVLVILSAGNLSLTQSAVNILEERIRLADGASSLMNARTLFEAATLLGDAVRQVRARDAPYLVQSNIDASATFLIGGQIAGDRQRLFCVYSEGNFIEATPETCYFQIGETKYGKPIIDRVVRRDISLTEAAKCTLVSFDSTMRSNVSVGLPIDLLVYEADSLAVRVQKTIDESDAYFQMIHDRWGEGLRRVFADLPDPEWG